MLGTAREVLLDPDGFFEDRAQNPRLRSAAAVVAGYATVRIVAGFLLFLVLLRGYSLPLVALGFFGFALTQSVIWFGSWLIITIECHAISYFFGGEGSFRRTFTLLGWGYLPVIAGGSLLIVANASTAIGAPSISLQSPQQAVTAVEQLRGGTSTRIANLVSSLLYVWSVYIWVFALKHARGLSTRQAIVAVVVPVVVSSGLSVLV